MKRKEMINNAQVEFSKLRQWAMERSYYAPENIKVNCGDIVFSGIVGTVAAANATTVGHVPTQAGMALASILVAKSLRIGSIAALIAHKTNFHKLPVEAMFNMVDKAKMIFKHTLDSMFRVPPDIIRAREFNDAIQKIHFQTKGMVGVALDNKNRFNTDTNIYLPSTQIVKDSPLYAKNKQIHSEIILMIKNGILSPSDIAEIDEYTKGVIKLSSSHQYEKMVNYAVLVPKLEEILMNIHAIQSQREGLKIDNAVAIEKGQLREEKGRIVKSKGSIDESNQALSTGIAEISAGISAKKELSTETKIDHNIPIAPILEKFAKDDVVSDINIERSGKVLGKFNGMIEVMFEDSAYSVYCLSDDLVNVSREIDRIESFTEEHLVPGTLKEAVTHLNDQRQSQDQSLK